MHCVGGLAGEAPIHHGEVRQIRVGDVAGVVVAVSRTSERLIEVPLVRNVIGNAEDNNPVRFRASQVVFSRLEHE